MSTLRVSNIQDTAGSNNSTPAAIANGIAKAWVNFNGTGTTATNQTIRASYNVSSVYKNATGDYTVNFTTALADTNFSVLTTVESVISGAAISPTVASGKTTSSVRTWSFTTGGTASDASSYHVAVFR